MLGTRKVARNCSSLLAGKRLLGFHPATVFVTPFSTKSGDASKSPPGSVELPQSQQTRSFSSAAGSPPPRSSPPGTVATPTAASGTDYLSLFQQPSYGNALTGFGAYSPGSVLKVYPLPRFVLKEDFLRHLEGSNLKPDNVKVVYNPTFRPDYVQVEVESASTQRQIMRRLQERGRLGCRVLRAEVSKPMPWTGVDAALKDSPRGRTLVMFNLNISTDFEDVERFFEGYSYDAHHIRFIKVGNNDPNRVRRAQSLHAAVGFTSKLEALRAMREKMGDFCANVAVNLRLIQ